MSKMSKSSWLNVIAVLLIVGLIVLAVLPSRPLPKTPLTPAMSEDFGAMLKVPEDVSFYASSMHIARRWQAVWESNAVQSLLQLPIVQQLSRHPALKQIQMQAEMNPLFVQGLPVLKDAISSEVFVCAGPELTSFFKAANEVMTAGRVAQIQELFESRNRYDDDVPGEIIEAVIDSVLANKKELRVPSVLIGCKLTDPAAAKKFLDTWIPKIGPLPVSEIETKKVAGAECYVLKLRGTDIPKDGYDTIREGLIDADISDDKADDFEAWLKSQELTIAIGIRDDYLMVSIAPDTGLLDRWGKGRSLAESEPIEPIRAYYQAGLIDISYVSADLVDVTEWTREDLEATSEALVTAIPDGDSTAKLKGRLEADLPLLVEDIAKELPETGSIVAFSIENDGIESYTFIKTSKTPLDCSKPLKILAHRGKDAMMYAAARAARGSGSYATAIKWTKIAFGYVEDFVVPTFRPRQRREFKKAMTVARPFLTSIDKTTRTNLIPSIDGVESILTVDGQGIVKQSPDGQELPKPLHVPRLSVAVQLNDVEKFKLAMGEYLDAVKALLASVKETYPDALPPDLEIPPYKEVEVVDGTLYFYQLPFDLGADVFPCAFIKDRLLVLSSSSKHVKAVAASRPMPKCPITRPDQAAGSVVALDGPACWKFLEHTADFALTMMEENARRQRDQQMAMVIRMHLTAVWRSLGAIRSYRSTTTYEGGYVIDHSWLRVKDIAP